MSSLLSLLTPEFWSLFLEVTQNPASLSPNMVVTEVVDPPAEPVQASNPEIDK